MRKRPLSITILGVLFILVGTVGLTYHATEFTRLRPFQWEVLAVCVIRLLAILGGVFLLRGHDWARWLLCLWLGYHVLLSGAHSLNQVLIHGVLLIAIAYLLFRVPVRPYFRSATAPPSLTEPPE